jgi:hypothetical protein
MALFSFILIQNLISFIVFFNYPSSQNQINDIANLVNELTNYLVNELTH